jgi:hypothetical protein
VQVALPEEEEESVDVSAAEMPAEERVAALHPPPAADTPEAHPADRVPPVSANTFVARIYPSDKDLMPKRSQVEEMSDEEKRIVREVDAAFAEDVLQAKARRRVAVWHRTLTHPC